MKHKEQDLIYLSGFFDGEGNISIVKQRFKRKNDETYYYYLKLVVANTNKGVVDWLKEVFGGNIITKPRGERNSNWNTCYNWVLASGAAKELLEELVPFLKIKRYQAVLACRLQERVMSSKKGGNKPTITKEENLSRERLKLAVSACNKHKELSEPPLYQSALQI